MASEEDIYDQIDARLQKSGGPAFPVARVSPSDELGMSLRDWFAGQALSGMLASESEKDGHYKADNAASRAYQIADYMIAARKAGAA